MSVITREETDLRAPVAGGAEPGVRRRPRRAGHGSGRGLKPEARPALPLRGPQLSGDAGSSAHGCEIRRPAISASTWRLTERGIAIIIATGLAIATAALVVVGLTAWRVTGAGYAPSGQIQMQR